MLLPLLMMMMKKQQNITTGVTLHCSSQTAAAPLLER